VAAHQIVENKSPHFRKLVERWKRDYPHIEEDLESAFKAIRQNLMANQASRIQMGPAVEVYKYRQNSKDIRRGASYGWRIVALYDRRTAMLHPVLVWPKPAWGDAAGGEYSTAIEEMLAILGYCTNDRCGGLMKPSIPPTLSIDGTSEKLTCDTCTVTRWKAQSAE
jgi:hypothetical protein